MTTFQAFADEISNHVQIGINSSFAPAYGVGQVAAVQVGVEQLGLSLSVIDVRTAEDVLAGFTAAPSSDVVLLDDVQDLATVHSLLELTQLKNSVVILRHREPFAGFTPLAV